MKSVVGAILIVAAAIASLGVGDSVAPLICVVAGVLGLMYLVSGWNDDCDDRNRHSGSS